MAQALVLLGLDGSLIRNHGWTVRNGGSNNTWKPFSEKCINEMIGPSVIGAPFLL